MSNLRKQLKYAGTLIYSDRRIEEYVIVKRIKCIQKEIDKNEDSENIVSDAYNKIGNLYYKIGNYKMAKKSYEKGLEINNNNIKIYSSLIHHAIEENNLNEAKRIIGLINIIEDDHIKKNLEILKLLIELFENNIDIEKVNITNDIVLKCIKKGDYDMLKMHNNNPVTFNSCITLMIEKLKSLNYSLKKQNIDLLLKNINEENYQEIIYELTKLYEHDKSIEIKIIKLCSSLIDLNLYNEALLLINLISKTNPNNHYLSYLKKRIYEEKKYINMGKEDYNKIVFFINQAKQCRQNFDSYGEFNNLLAGEYVTGDPCFNYYFGKYYYSQKDYKTAMDCFKKYEEEGILKLNKCYYYMYWTEKKLKGNPNKYLKKYKKYSLLYEDDPQEYINYLEEYSDSMNSKQDPDYDSVKNQQTKYIDMTVDDFVKSKKL